MCYSSYQLSKKNKKGKRKKKMTSKAIEREVKGNKVSIVKFKGQKSGKVRYWVRINDFDNYISRKVLITIKDVNDFVKTHTN